MSELALQRPDHDDRALDVIRPVANAQTLVSVFREYQQVKEAILTDDDYAQIGGKPRPKKSAWRKLATAMSCSLSLKPGSTIFERDDQGRIRSAEAIAVATAANGRYSDGWGGAEITERCCPRNCTTRHEHCPAARGIHDRPEEHWSHPYHDMRALAETRAKNRAASDLFGFGEVSAEEINDGAGGGYDEEDPPRSRQRGSSGRSDGVRAGWRNKAEQDRHHAELQQLLADADLQDWSEQWLHEQGWTWPLDKGQLLKLRNVAGREQQRRHQAGDRNHEGEGAAPEPEGWQQPPAGESS